MQIMELKFINYYIEIRINILMIMGKVWVGLNLQMLLTLTIMFLVQ